MKQKYIIIILFLCITSTVKSQIEKNITDSLLNENHSFLFELGYDFDEGCNCRQFTEFFNLDDPRSSDYFPLSCSLLKFYDIDKVVYYSYNLNLETSADLIRPSHCFIDKDSTLTGMDKSKTVNCEYSKLLKYGKFKIDYVKEEIEIRFNNCNYCFVMILQYKVDISNNFCIILKELNTNNSNSKKILTKDLFGFEPKFKINKNNFLILTNK
ncbi:MAG: hypothetical protein IPN79_12895 [Saprospiraceae bacterium]|nr:hypothetical protein [Saprospiraceae bacterium]